MKQYSGSGPSLRGDAVNQLGWSKRAPIPSSRMPLLLLIGRRILPADCLEDPELKLMYMELSMLLAGLRVLTSTIIDPLLRGRSYLSS